MAFNLTSYPACLKPPWQEHKPAVKTYHYESNIKMKTAIIASLVAGAAAFAPAANKVSDRTKPRGGVDRFLKPIYELACMRRHLFFDQ